MMIATALPDVIDAPHFRVPAVTSQSRQRLRRRPAKDRETRPLLDETLFQSVLSREQKRADRFDQPVVVLLLSLTEGDPDLRSTLWSSAIEAVGAATRQTDVLGWFQRGNIIGVVLPEIAAPSDAIMQDLKARIRRELARRLDARTMAKVAIATELYTHPKHTASDPVWRPDSPARANRTQRYRRLVRDSAKRTLDVAGSLALLLLFAPVFLVVAALIKLKSTGPVFFRQPRIGQGAVPFTCFKFRTMHANADHAVHHAFVSHFIKAGSAAEAEAPETGVFKIVNDPRVTSLGRILRQTSLDELPQLWNVLRGDMSLVGPRPPLGYEVEEYRAWHWQRVMAAKPGLTGLWQVEGRSRTSFDGMVRLDLRYVRRCSLWTDIKILLATPAAVMSRKGAC